MNTYERIYTLLIRESTPIGREESRTVGQAHGKLGFSKGGSGERERTLARTEGGAALQRGKVRVRVAAGTRSRPKPAPQMRTVRSAGISAGLSKVFGKGHAQTRTNTPPQER